MHSHRIVAPTHSFEGMILRGPDIYLEGTSKTPIKRGLMIKKNSYFYLNSPRLIQISQEVTSRRYLDPRGTRMDYVSGDEKNEPTRFIFTTVTGNVPGQVSPGKNSC